MNKNLSLSGFVALLAALSLLLVACGGGGGGPEGVATSFLKTMAKADLDGAAKYCTEEGAASLNMLSSLMKSMGSDEKGDFGADFKGSITKVEEDGDAAIVYYRPEGAEEDKTLNMKKVEGKWKVDFQKDM